MKKLCPILYASASITYGVICIGKECAMWREGFTLVMRDTIGWCGIAGKPEEVE